MSSEVEDLDALQGQVHTLLTLRYLIGQFERFMFPFPVVFY